jgi:hypothetical protein
LAASSFLVLRLRLGGGDEVRAPSRMTRAPLLRLGGVDGGSRLTVVGVDADDRDADLGDDRPLLLLLAMVGFSSSSTSRRRERYLSLQGNAKLRAHVF